MILENTQELITKIRIQPMRQNERLMQHTCKKKTHEEVMRSRIEPRIGRE